MPDPLTGGLITGSARALSGATLMARIRGNQGTLITQASILSVGWTCTNLATGIASGTGTLTVTQVVFNNLQQSDPRWTRDSSDTPGPDGQWGYNFAFALPAAALPSGGVRYQIDAVFVPISGESFRVSWSVVPVTVYA
jgi:hypothetical protein